MTFGHTRPETTITKNTEQKETNEMKQNRLKLTALFLIALIAFLAIPTQQIRAADASSATTWRVLWSHYTGWEIWEYIRAQGIMDRHAAKNNVKIKIELVNDYIESINQYTVGKDIAGCAMTQIDALNIPCAGGVDSTVLIAGDYSNGNDGVALKNGTTLADIKGRKVFLGVGGVSHYLLVRGLESETKLRERDVTLLNTTDTDITAAFAGGGPKAAVVTYNPMLLKVKQEPNTLQVYSSTNIPEEIIDLMVVKTSAPDGVKKALTDSWYEAMKIMSGGDAKAEEMIAFMAAFAGGTLGEFKSQLKTTRMFYDPAEAAALVKSPKLKKTMEHVRTFSFDHGLLGDGVKSKDAIGIEFPDGSVIGSKANVKLRFKSSYMEKVSRGK